MWSTFWGLFLIASLVVFGGVAIVVTFRGFGEARGLFRPRDGRRSDDRGTQ